MPALAGYARRAAANGVPLQPLTAAEIRRLEPAVRAVAGLYSGIDRHRRQPRADAGAARRRRTGRRDAGHPHAGDRGAHRAGRNGRVAPAATNRSSCAAATLVNAAGLRAQRTGPAHPSAFRRKRAAGTFYAKGHYFTLSGRAPFRHLVYPMPDHAGLGHSRDARPRRPVQVRPGRQRLASDAGLCVRVRAGATSFTGRSAATTRTCRTARCNRATPACGPKVTGPTEAAGDFIIQGPARRTAWRAGEPVWHRVAGADGVVAIAERVAAKLAAN